MRRLTPLAIAAAGLLATTAPAQAPSPSAPVPDATPMGDPAAMPPASPGGTDLPGTEVKPGMPSDVHTTPPPVASQAPPPTAGDTAPTESKSRGRARASSTAKKRPQG